MNTEEERVFIFLKESNEVQKLIQYLKDEDISVIHYPNWNGETLPYKCNVGVIDIDEDLPLFQSILTLSDNTASIVIASQDRENTLKQILDKGAWDFVIKPWNPKALALRIKMIINKRLEFIRTKLYMIGLETRVNTRTEELWVKTEKIKGQFIATIDALILALQAKHRYTEGHSRRVAELSVKVAKKLGLKYQDIRNIEIGALFHDLGKLGIRDEVLNKPGKLTPEEFEHIKLHPLIAANILSPFEELCAVSNIVKHEHERYDGNGYPGKIEGDNIPIGSRIIAIVDAFDALTSNRAYRKLTDCVSALDEIKKNSGTQFDPHVVNAFVEIISEKEENNHAKEKKRGEGSG